MFFSFDGVDGSGKTTQIELFCDWLRERGLHVTACRDPGSTPLGEAVRKILLEKNEISIARRSEMLLYMAARAQLVEEVIAPALSAGQTVVSDRYLLANVVYQGHAGGLDVPSLWQVGQIATGGLEPDLTFVLDLPDDQAAGRLNRELDRMERQGEAFRKALRAGYLAEAARRPERIVVIDASRSIEAVQNDIRAAAGRVLGGGGENREYGRLA
ncbi:MAG TPA: dTMP kinase [Pirellulales bacterium]|nr:dTMP kinase [Pirellulales bacterium]